MQGKLADITFELLGKGRALAGALGSKVVGVLLGHGARDLAGQMGGADTVLYVDHPALAQFTPDAYERTLSALIKDRQPAVVLMGNTSVGMDLAPGLSAGLGLPLLAYCSDIQVSGGRLVATSKLYGGKVMVEADGGESCLATWLTGSSPADAGRSGGAAAVEDAAAPSMDGLRTRFVNLIQPEAGDVDITREDILVSVGRGIGGQENLEIAEDLAKALGGALSASRPIIDNGWLPKARQVGKSGMTVKPKLYLACGISGAPEHLEGMRDADLIIAINTDPGAPIFDVADYGVVGDIFDILPALTEKVAG